MIPIDKVYQDKDLARPWPEYPLCRAMNYHPGLMTTHPDTWEPILALGPNKQGKYRLVDGLLRLAVAKARGFTMIKARTHL